MEDPIYTGPEIKHDIKHDWYYVFAHVDVSKKYLKVYEKDKLFKHLCNSN